VALCRDLADGPAVVLGTVVRNPAATGRGLFNAAVVVAGGRVSGCTRSASSRPTTSSTRPATCVGRRPWWSPSRAVGGDLDLRDLWPRDPVDGRRLYDVDPPADLVRAGAEIVVNLSASLTTRARTPAAGRCSPRKPPGWAAPS
jgi:hypothetical protein